MTLEILFVCTGNVCRSPIAERLATAYAATPRGSAVSAASAGVRALVARPMHDDAARVLEDLGGDPSGFSARQLTSRIASNADLILTMTRQHRDAVLEMSPRALRRTFTLGEAARLVTDCAAQSLSDLADLRPRLSGVDIPDIADPIGHGADVFAEVGLTIARLLPPVIDLCVRSE